MLSCFWNCLYPLQQKCRSLVLQRQGTEQSEDAPRSLEVAPLHIRGDLGSLAISFHSPIGHVSSSVEQICKRISGSQLPLSLALLLQLPSAFDLISGQHQQQWELSEKMRKEKGQNLLPIVKSY